MHRQWCVMLIVWLSACSAAMSNPAATPPASRGDQFAEERKVWSKIKSSRET